MDTPLIYLEDFDDQLLMHFEVDAYLRNDGILTESHGSVDNIVETCRCFFSAVSNQAYDTIEKGITTTVTYTEENAELGNPDFNQFSIVVTMFKAEKEGYKCGFASEKSFDYTTTPVTYKPHIRLNLQSPTAFGFKMLAFFCLSHELTHGYNILQYIRKTGKPYKRPLSYFLANKQNNFSKNGTPDKIIGWLEYTLGRYERNAYIGQLRQELELATKHKPFLYDDPNKAFDVIKQTESYKKRCSQLHDYIQYINQEQDKNKQQELLASYNRISSTPLNTYNQLLKKYNARFDKWCKKFIIQASKMIDDLYEEQNRNTLWMEE